MPVCCAVLAAAIIAFSVLSRREFRKSSKEVPYKGESFFYPAALKIFAFTKYKLKISAKTEKIESLKKLYIGMPSSAVEKIYFCKLYSYVILIIIVMLFAAVILTLAPSEKNVLKNSYFIEREDPGGIGKNYEFNVEIGKDKREVAIDVSERKYGKKEYERKLKEAKEYVKNSYLGGNKSSEAVDSPLNLVNSIPDSAIGISWECDANNIVGEDGTLDQSQIDVPEEAIITAVFEYGDEKEEMPLEITVIPREKTKSEILWEKWQDTFSRLKNETEEKKYLRLPSEVNGKKVSYSEKGQNLVLLTIIFSIAVIACTPAIMDSRTKEKIKEREQQLRLDYPEFVEKFVLLISAGLNCKGAWSRIVEEYLKKRETEKERRYLYEEMLLTKKQLDNGMNESKAYELFGRRTGLLKYMKFSTLLVQNLKKGSSNLLNILEYEAGDVLKERRENAKILGDQAGTKLLMPMMLMMVEVFAIIIYAAFQNM